MTASDITACLLLMRDWIVSLYRSCGGGEGRLPRDYVWSNCAMMTRSDRHLPFCELLIQGNDIIGTEIEIGFRSRYWGVFVVPR